MAVETLHASPLPGAPAVLLVEDEPLILDLMQNSLEDGGFVVLTAADGEAALARLELNACRDINVLVTDIRVGKVVGWQIATRGRELNPSLHVIYTSGDSGHDWASLGVPNSMMLVKPFAPAQLVTAVAQLVND